MAKTGDPLYMHETTCDVDVKYAVPETEGDIPEEWVQNWWFAKLDRLPVGKVSLDRMFTLGDSSDSQLDQDAVELKQEDENIYSWTESVGITGE